MSITEAIANRNVAAAKLEFEIIQRRKEKIIAVERSANELLTAIQALREVEELLDDNQKRLDAVVSKNKEDEIIEAEHAEENATIATLQLNMKDVFYRSDPSTWRELLDVVDLPVLEESFENTDNARLLLIEAALQRAILKQRGNK